MANSDPSKVYKIYLKIVFKKNKSINNQMIRDFGQEDTSFISKYDMRMILITHFRGIKKLVKLIFFNEDQPQNHNIVYKLTDNENLYVYENGELIAINTEYILDTIVVESWKKIAYYYYELEQEDKLKTLKDSLISEETYERITQFINDYSLLCDGKTPFLYQDIKKDIYDLIKILGVEKPEKIKKKRKTTSSS